MCSWKCKAAIVFIMATHEGSTWWRERGIKGIEKWINHINFSVVDSYCDFSFIVFHVIFTSLGYNMRVGSTARVFYSLLHIHTQSPSLENPSHVPTAHLPYQAHCSRHHHMKSVLQTTTAPHCSPHHHHHHHWQTVPYIPPLLYCSANLRHLPQCTPYHHHNLTVYTTLSSPHCTIPQHKKYLPTITHVVPH